ncbi:hypothetical protein [Bacillus mycoides]|uniref:hypothetical protein n=1 Tax=Bacillus mycoides TaxID=1405 RepID=UPI00292CED55|nr:hypothetical protein [Bacillus mycoides]WOA60818.1 hypothetical protein RVY74_30615 [Bacillus mycoides]
MYFFACFNVQIGVEARIWIGSGNNGLTFFPSRCRENFVLKRALSQPSISANSFKPTRGGITQFSQTDQLATHGHYPAPTYSVGDHGGAPQQI